MSEKKEYTEDVILSKKYSTSELEKMKHQMIQSLIAVADAIHKDYLLEKRRQVLNENRKKRHKKIEFDKEKVQNLSLDAQKNRLEEYCKRKDLLLLSHNYVDNLSKNAKHMIEQKNKIKSD